MDWFKRMKWNKFRYESKPSHKIKVNSKVATIIVHRTCSLSHQSAVRACVCVREWDPDVAIAFCVRLHALAPCTAIDNASQCNKSIQMRATVRQCSPFHFGQLSSSLLLLLSAAVIVVDCICFYFFLFILPSFSFIQMFHRSIVLSLSLGCSLAKRVSIFLHAIVCGYIYILCVFTLHLLDYKLNAQLKQIATNERKKNEMKQNN